ncbi:MAG TPA: TIGR02301 family protein [Hyphomicrobiaceae bacterium]|jgi:uncharacterized protein (TIGR02301 family)
MQSALATCGKLWIALSIGMAAVTPAAAQSAIIGSDTRPYDERLMRLSEILGAIHYLRELCGSNDGQAWRDRMKELMDAEGSTALRRAKLTRSFNNGYRSYSRTYNNCTPSAQTAITRFLSEGAELAEALIKSVP